MDSNQDRFNQLHKRFIEEGNPYNFAEKLAIKELTKELLKAGYIASDITSIFDNMVSSVLRTHKPRESLYEHKPRESYYAKKPYG